MATHYDVLGLAPTANAKEIRAAFRSLARQLHPDVNQENQAVDRFIQVKEAYEVLSDATRRKNYDEVLKLRSAAAEQKEAGSGSSSRPPVNQKVSKPEPYPLRDKMSLLTKHLSRMDYGLAEETAAEILRHDSRNALAYAALGDLARVKGDLVGATKHYSYALQFDPSNSLYERKYMELMSGSGVAQKVGKDLRPDDIKVVPLGVASFVVLMLTSLLFLAPFGSFEFSAISTWTFTNFFVYLLSGFALGVALPRSGIVDSFILSQSRGVAKTSDAGIFFGICGLNFWLALSLVIIKAIRSNWQNISLLRMACGIGFLAGFYSIVALSTSTLAGFQAFLWSPGFIALGSLMGWRITSELP
ncbi:MAG: DnaJ domain-containing protein [Fimbriimonadaceae bacterium]|nr:DnaJ domain-containing protein [Fimbriimonadaceae bacterium]